MTDDKGDLLGIPGFERPRLVGRGGFGAVYRVEQPKLDREVAIKLLDMVGVDEQVRRRFDREQRVMGSLSSHPGIVTLHDTGYTEGGRPYLVMELMTGGSLKDRLADGPMRWREACSILLTITDAVGEAHAQGVLHRDIKPDNILVSAFGEAKLTDFGIASLLEGTVTSTTSVSATLEYAPPEILAGEIATPAADIYSLAATLYALLAGKSAFRKESDENLLALLNRVLTSEVPDLQEQGIPPPIWELTKACMSKDKADRPQTAEAFTERLQDAVRRAELADPDGPGIAELGIPRVSGPVLVVPGVDPGPAPGLAATEIVKPEHVAAVKSERSWSFPSWSKWAGVGIIGLVLILVGVFALSGNGGDNETASTTAGTSGDTAAVVVGQEGSAECLDTETLLYSEDFDDGLAQDWDGVDPEISTGLPGWSIGRTEGSDDLWLTIGYRGGVGLGTSVLNHNFGDSALRFWLRAEGLPATEENLIHVGWHHGTDLELNGSAYDEAYYGFFLSPATGAGQAQWIATPPGASEPVSLGILYWDTPITDEWSLIEIVTQEVDGEGLVQLWIDGQLQASYTDPGYVDNGEMLVSAEIPIEGGAWHLDDVRVCGLEGSFESAYEQLSESELPVTSEGDEATTTAAGGGEAITAAGSAACLSGETPLFGEDFDDGFAGGFSDADSQIARGTPGWSIVEVDDPGEGFALGVGEGDGSALAFGVDVETGDAALRFHSRAEGFSSDEPGFFHLSWHDGPGEIDGVAYDESAYGFEFRTGEGASHVTWGAVKDGHPLSAWLFEWDQPIDEQWRLFEIVTQSEGDSGNIQLWIDGELVGTYDDSAYIDSGSLSFDFYETETGAFFFDNVSICGLEGSFESAFGG